MDISWINLIFSYVLLSIPIFVFAYFNTGLIKSALIAVARMSVQLFLVGFYLEYIFKYDNPYINILWVFAMVVIATYTSASKTGIQLKFFIIPSMLAIISSLIIIDFFFLGFILKLNNPFTARYFIPITGMMVGNCMERNILALNHYYKSLKKEQYNLQYILSLGATKREALKLFVKEAIISSFNPLIANMAVMGLIALPGTMTGQILGGSNPNVAIKYQIMLMLSIFIATILTVSLTLIIGNKYIIDKFGNVNLSVFLKK